MVEILKRRYNKKFTKKNELDAYEKQTEIKSEKGLQRLKYKRPSIERIKEHRTIIEGEERGSNIS